jgi:hypothetical protein
MPDVTVEGVFEVAVHLGLTFLDDEKILAVLKQSSGDYVFVSGLQRRGGKGAACLVSTDVAEMAKLRSKKAQKRGERTRRVRGV